MRASFNYIGGSRTRLDAGGVPVWLGVVSPYPVGGVLAPKYAVPGAFIPAGTPINLTDKVITPFVGWEVVSVDAGSHAVTVKAGNLGFLPGADDIIGVVGDSLSATGAAAQLVSVTAAEEPGQYVFTFADANLDTVTAGKILTPSAASAAGASGNAIAAVPNAYLYNDIRIPVAEAGETFEDTAATGAAVMSHGEGILIDRTPGAGIKDMLKSAIPNVIQVNG